MTLLLSAAVAVAAAFHPAGYDQQVLLACSAPLGEQPTLRNVTVADAPAGADGLAALRVTAKGLGAYLNVYYDAGSERIARARAACLGEQVAALSRTLGDDRRDAQWSSVVFTQDADYKPPRGEGVVTHWVVNVAADGTLDPLQHKMVVNTMPHEQVHAWQRRNDTALPRWVAEGHAEWVNTKVAPSIDPIVSARTLRRDQEFLAGVEEEIDLSSWGSVRPKREAIMRQVSPEDRARMDADPDYSPSGSFSFTSDDFEVDISNEAAHYPVALAVFEGLETRHGETAVHAWMAELSAQPGRIDEEKLAASVERHFGEDLDALLR